MYIDLTQLDELIYIYHFDEDDTLLCALNRIFDNAIVYMMDGKSYRGRKLETVAVKVGSTSDLLDPAKQ